MQVRKKQLSDKQRNRIKRKICIINKKEDKERKEKLWWIIRKESDNWNQLIVSLHQMLNQCND